MSRNKMNSRSVLPSGRKALPVAGQFDHKPNTSQINIKTQYKSAKDISHYLTVGLFGNWGLFRWGMGNCGNRRF